MSCKDGKVEDGRVKILRCAKRTGRVDRWGTSRKGGEDGGGEAVRWRWRQRRSRTGEKRVMNGWL